MAVPAQRLPHLSPARLGQFKTLLRILQRVSPRLAARAAFMLFLRPMRRRLSAADEAFMASAKRHRLQAGRDSVQTYEWGSGPRTLVIVHGWGSRVSRFAPLASALTARGWRVLAFDAPGHGLSPGRSSSLPQFMAALDAVALQQGPVHALIGHSLGALAIGSRAESREPDWTATLQKLVLVSMPAGAPFLVESFQRMLGIGPAAAARMQQLFRQRFSADPAIFAVRHAAALLQLPTLLVHDRGDDIVPLGHSEQLLPQLANARLLVTERLGHSDLTRDADTISAIGDFLAEDIGNAASTRAGVTVRRAVLRDAADVAAIISLLDAYATDPRGGGKPLADEVKQRLAVDFGTLPHARVWLAFDGDQAIGVCVAFVGYSTFAARPLLNIHDLAVLPGRRGRGTGAALLAAAETGARAEQCCKLTLEVQDDNTPARSLYERSGFVDVRYGNSGPTRFLAKPLPVSCCHSAS